MVRDERLHSCDREQVTGLVKGCTSTVSDWYGMLQVCPKGTIQGEVPFKNFFVVYMFFCGETTIRLCILEVLLYTSLHLGSYSGSTENIFGVRCANI